MKTHDTTQHGATSTILTGAILFANLNPTGLCDYAVKAAIGGLIWLGFKLAGDYFSLKLKDKWLNGKK